MEPAIFRFVYRKLPEKKTGGDLRPDGCVKVF